jgi:hypothetical protein
VSVADRHPETGCRSVMYRSSEYYKLLPTPTPKRGGHLFLGQTHRSAPMVAFASRPTREFVLPNTNSRVGLHDILLWGDKPKGPKAALLGETKVMVLKHAPLGEINHPFVASSAIIPRCRRRPMLIPHRRTPVHLVHPLFKPCIDLNN